MTQIADLNLELTF